ncbi:MAG: extracellular solute-binding protein [Chloroflexia bacterium]|nr:extracellular solute-binding protein [Chloroflexia bacterium]
MRPSLRTIALAGMAALTPLAMLAPVTRAQDNVELTMWLDTTGGSEGAECVQANAIDVFNAQGNGITVNATMQANAWDATRTAIAGGAGPDIVGTPGPSFAMQLALAGQLAALDDYAKDLGWDERFAPGSLDLGMADGKLYSIPTELETLVLYYNKTLFEEHGWEPPKTLDELMTLAATVQEAGIIPFSHANAEWRPANEWFVGEMLNHSAGGPQKVYDALVGNVEWTDPDFVAAIDALNQMQQNGWFMGGLDRYYTTTFPEAGAILGAGEAAMNIEGTWFLADEAAYFGEEAGNSNEIGWVPVPSVSGDAIFDLGIGNTYSINNNSQHKDEAAKFIDFWFSPENQAKLLVECGTVPAAVDLTGQDLTGVNPNLAEILAAMNKAFAEGNYGYTTWTFWPPASETYLIEEIERVWAGEITPEEYLAGHQVKFDAARTAGAVPPIPER